jgi:hypothetical protein
MRLAKVERGDSLRKRVLFGIIRLASGFRAADVVRTLSYRMSYFGAHQNALSEATMRGPSPWSVGERELFAAFVSRVNQCPF